MFLYSSETNKVDNKKIPSAERLKKESSFPKGS